MFAIAIGGTAFLALLAWALSLVLKTPLGPQLSWSFNDLFIGVIATLPLAGFLWWFSKTDNPTLARFRESQIRFFADIGFDFTASRIVLMAISAGFCEELLFRGVLQTWVAGFAPVMVAVIATNIVFGLLHMRTMLYAIVAGCVGIYLGALYALTDNLMIPMVTHGLYDFIALIYTRNAIDAYRRVPDDPV